MWRSKQPCTHFQVYIYTKQQYYYKEKKKQRKLITQKTVEKPQDRKKEYIKAKLPPGSNSCCETQRERERERERVLERTRERDRDRFGETKKRFFLFLFFFFFFLLVEEFQVWPHGGNNIPFVIPICGVAICWCAAFFLDGTRSMRWR